MSGGGGGRGAQAIRCPEPDLVSARATMAAGYRAYRMGASDGGVVDNIFNTRERVRAVAEACKAAREGVGKGDFTIDFHQRFDYADALRCCKLIEEYEPYLVEDPVRDEHALQDIPKLRQMTTCPLAAGEEWGPALGLQQAGGEPRHRLHPRHAAQRRRHHRDDEGRGHVRDARGGHRPAFHRAHRHRRAGELPVDVLRPVLMEYNYGGRPIDYLPECLDFKNGKAYPNDRPGLGVTLD